jgi:hypothetical protein
MNDLMDIYEKSTKKDEADPMPWMCSIANTSGIRTLDKKKVDLSCYLLDSPSTFSLQVPLKLDGYTFGFVGYGWREEKTQVLIHGGKILQKGFQV